jgi:hypothetical protein
MPQISGQSSSLVEQSQDPSSFCSQFCELQMHLSRQLSTSMITPPLLIFGKVMNMTGHKLNMLSPFTTASGEGNRTSIKQDIIYRLAISFCWVYSKSLGIREDRNSCPKVKFFFFFAFHFGFLVAEFHE